MIMRGETRLVRWFHLLAGSVQPGTCLSNTLGLIAPLFVLFVSTSLLDQRLRQGQIVILSLIGD